MTSISKNEILEFLSLEGEERNELYERAVETRNKTVSNSLYLRGLIEFSNICANDCLYCGIRKSNSAVQRYEYRAGDIIPIVGTIAETGISSIVLQSGERQDAEFVSYVIELLEAVKDSYPEMVITLSAGEQSREIYKAFSEAGADRYLLRIETSNKEHYEKLHPDSMSFENRVNCLNILRDIGYQVGTGIMIGSPFQSIENLADDILFFQKLDIDMCGMGPYIPHGKSPFAFNPYCGEEALELGLKMIAVLRIAMPDINIAATTALEALSTQGRELGLFAGANVIMPQFSPEKTRKEYQLYDNKPMFEEDYIQLFKYLKDLSERCKMKLDLENPGDSLHFKRRMKNVSAG